MYGVETIKGQKFFVARDDKGRTVIGPKRHRAGGLWFTGIKKKGAAMADNDNTVTIVVGEEMPPRERTLRERAREGWWKWRARLQDKEWHENSRQTAVTLFAWVALGSLAVMFLKLAVWAVTL